MIATIDSDFVSSLLGTLGGGCIAVLVAFLTDRWGAGRERRMRRDELRLRLYLEVVELILENERLRAESGQRPDLPPVEIQLRRLSVSHRLKLLGTTEVNAAYKSYGKAVFEATSLPLDQRSKATLYEFDALRESVIDAMAKDFH